MALSILNLLLLFISSPITLPPTSAVTTSSSPTSLNTTHLLKSFCNTKPYPDSCFDSLKLSISITINPNILTYLLQTLQTAISEATKLTTLISSAASSSNILQPQIGTIQDCQELHQITLSSLQKSVSRIQSNDKTKLADARAYLSAALTNKNTCLENLASASGPLKSVLVSSLINTYKHVSNSLAMIPNPNVNSKKKGGNNNTKNRRLLGFPKWLSGKDRRILEGDDGGDEYDPSEVIIVAADGSGNFSSISEAINFAPNNSFDRVIIAVKEGVYEEYVEIPSYKTNIVLIGDGSEVTFITGNRSVDEGWTTFRSATLAVSGEGFLARDITIENTAGPQKHQAVAVRINADLAAMYRCTINGYQDTLYVHSFRQFYRECDIYGTIDYIFGNAAVVFQACNIVSKMPLPGQFTVVTAQSREIPEQDTGISIQNCSILATDDLYSNSSSVKSYLGRPWRVFSRSVILESYIDDFINPTGWTEWSGDQGLDTLYYGEYDNYGPGSATADRVTWQGFHVMDYYDAFNFTVTYFITGDEWLDSTSFPYDDSI
ncbi:probable pectinesterase/pectinesterase inhibitor 12 [Mercurialis annua]|uniref:probable pectinesterase/pectinesterase inhibitor 12 n=1 Tax=Mercurialis annua TaxID=3986 RepID=UPI00215E72E3|nr:probable pectinesterase/pectinesterase inhibitor 12 [Mercurialis annua]